MTTTLRFTVRMVPGSSCLELVGAQGSKALIAIDWDKDGDPCLAWAPPEVSELVGKAVRAMVRSRPVRAAVPVPLLFSPAHARLLWAHRVGSAWWKTRPVVVPPRRTRRAAAPPAQPAAN